MANVLLTQKCVRNCPYCFAKEQMKNEPDVQISLDNLIYIADMHDKSNMKHISLLGGEPTLHPEFTSFVTYLHDRNFAVNTFTSGIMSQAKLDELYDNIKDIDPMSVAFVCNVNEPADNTKSELASLFRFFEKFGPYISCGFNIYKPDFDMHFIIDYIKKYNMKKHIRIGLTHPILGEENRHLQKKDMKEMSKQFVFFVSKFEEEGISAGFDCGMPMCLFDDASLGKLFKANSGKLKFKCGPAIDIGPDMDVWACFPLSNFKRKSFFEFDSMQDVMKYYEDIHEEIRKEHGGIFAECVDCKYFKNRFCSGGCLSHVIPVN